MKNHHFRFQTWRRRLRTVSDIFLYLLGGLILFAFFAFCTRIFVFDQFPVPTKSMEPSIQPGDRIVVNKLLFGARIYKNLDFLEGKPLQALRIKGWRKIKINDILVFNAPMSEDWQHIAFDIRKVFAKRCVALPGDTLSIVNGWYTNHRNNTPPGNMESQKSLSLTPKSSLAPVILQSFPQDTLFYPWDIKDFGPLWIPAKGKTIPMNPAQSILYKKIMEYETGKQVTLKGGRVYLNNTPIENYVFQQNYYFVAGDAVLDSQDSRYFGLVPEIFIIGIAPRILFHRDPSSNRWDWKRCLKKIY